jgi:demethylmenaquinone methyltransferase/2-methoxy-6-polyprenyl-1,4-benzoquinol methylase
MKKTFKKLYPESGVELTPFVSKHYDTLMNWGSMGGYQRFINDAISTLKIEKGEKIVDLGCGTGRNASIMLPYLKGEGQIVGVDVSDIMKSKFEKRFENDPQVIFKQQRIDQPFDLQQTFNRVFISFVIHGFPHEVRQTIIENAYRHLEVGGVFAILDFAEFNMDEMPAFHRFVFKKIECPYAFDYIQKDWKSILSEKGFSSFNERFFFKNYVRLLQAKKK